MSTNKETNEEKVPHLYDAFNLTNEQSRKVIDTCAPIMNKYGSGGVPNCDVAKECMNAVESTDEKLYAVHLFGIYYGVLQNAFTEIDAVEYFSEA